MVSLVTACDRSHYVVVFDFVATKWNFLDAQATEMSSMSGGRSLGFQPEYSLEIPTGKMPMLRLETGRCDCVVD